MRLLCKSGILVLLGMRNLWSLIYGLCFLLALSSICQVFSSSSRICQSLCWSFISTSCRLVHSSLSRSRHQPYTYSSITLGELYHAVYMDQSLASSTCSTYVSISTIWTSSVFVCVCLCSLSIILSDNQSLFARYTTVFYLVIMFVLLICTIYTIPYAAFVDFNVTLFVAFNTTQSPYNICLQSQGLWLRPDFSKKTRLCGAELPCLHFLAVFLYMFRHVTFVLFLV